MVEELRALFVVSIYNYHREVQPVIENFVRNGWRVTVLIGWLGESADEAFAKYSAVGCTVERVPQAMAYRGDTAISAEKSARTSRPVKTTSSGPSIARRLIGLMSYLKQMLSVRIWVAGYIRRSQPTVVLSGPFHSFGTFDNAFLLESRIRGLHHCCYPVSAYHGKIGAISARLNNLKMGMLEVILRADFDALNRLIAKLQPQWTRTIEEVTIFMWDPMGMLSARWLGLMNADVWQKPSPNFDTVFVFNRFSQRLLEQSEFPTDKVCIVGIPLLDAVLARTKVSRASCSLFADLGLQVDEPFLLFNVEPSVEHHYCDYDRHWDNFRAMMEIATKQGLPVVLSLHPLCNIKDYVFAEKEFGVHISRAWKIHDLYPHCKLIVSFPCSTNLIAEAFNKPLVIYDFFMMAHPDSPRVEEFRLPGAKIGHTLAEVERNIAEVVSTQMLFDEVHTILPTVNFLPASDAIRIRIENTLGAASTTV